MAAPNSSVPTTSLPIERTGSTVTVLDGGGPKTREAEASVFDKWPQQTENYFKKKNEVSHPSQYPRAGMLWIGDVEDADSVDDLITSASVTGRPIPDLENLDFKIASGRKKIQATPEERRHCKDRHKVAQPNEGGGSRTVKDRRTPVYKPLVQW